MLSPPELQRDTSSPVTMVTNGTDVFARDVPGKVPGLGALQQLPLALPAAQPGVRRARLHL